MSRNNEGVSVVVRALDELPEDQRAIYSARYVQDEPREATCVRLGIEPARYDELLETILRNMRRMVTPVSTQLASA
jgi:DNA-directed RNA polymerase specialized sigma24 family protein